MLARVAFRHLISRQALKPSVDEVQRLVQRRDYEKALDLVEGLFGKLDVVLIGEKFHVHTEWLSGLNQSDRDRFMDVLQTLMSVREGLRVLQPSMRRTEDQEREEPDRVLDLLDQVKSDMGWVDTVRRDESDVFKHGPFQIYMLEGASDGLDESLATLDKVADLIRPKFPEVLYGKVYVRRFPNGNVAGAYVYATDIIHLSLYITPTRGSIQTLIHEFGHRYHARFIKGDLRDKFIELSTVGDVRKEVFSVSEREKIADELIALFAEHRKENYPDPKSFLSERARLFSDNYPREEYKRVAVPLVHRFRDEGDDSVVGALRKAEGRLQYGGDLEVIIDEKSIHPLYASDYGRESWQENFAESFLAFVLGRPLPEPIEKLMRSL